MRFVPAFPRRILTILTGILVLVPVYWSLKRPDPDAGRLRVTILDVGQGDGIVVETPSGRVMVIDGGGSNDESRADQTDVGLRVMVPYLRARGISRVDVLVLTHPHGDHVGGLPAVIRSEEIGAVLDGTALPYPSPAYRAFRALVRQKHLPYHQAVRGQSINLGDGVRADVLNPPGDLRYGTNSDDATVNNYSVVLRLTYGRTHVLLMGDAETQAEEFLLSQNDDLAADALKAGHHGAANATGDAFLAHVRPTYAAISCGARNLFGHPSPATLARLTAHQVQVFTTPHSGAITFISDGRAVTAHPFLADHTADRYNGRQ